MGPEEMGSAREVARVRRETLSACMTCPLCRGLLREATAIAECLHTFCRECIMKEINDEDIDRCPVCNIDLGGDPEEKLRPDHNLQDIRNKIFPIKSENVASSKGATAIQPAKRKQRSLSSLVVDTPRVEIKAGVTGRRTKATRRRTVPHATSPDKDGTMNLSNKPQSQNQTSEKHTAPQSTKVVTTANKKQQNTDVDAPKKLSSEDRKNIRTTDNEELQKPLNSFVDATGRTKLPRSSPKIRAVKEQVIRSKEGELSTKKEERENEAVISGTKTRSHLSKSRSKEKNIGSSSGPASSKEKTRTEDILKKETHGSASMSALLGAVTTPVWFSLVASSEQKEEPQLPQLPKKYLRIKDGTLQISSVQKYIMTKLDLASADEVEITCHGEPVSPSTTVHSLIDQWMRGDPGEPIQASLDAPAEKFVMELGYRRRYQLAPAP